MNPLNWTDEVPPSKGLYNQIKSGSKTYRYTAEFKIFDVGSPEMSTKAFYTPELHELFVGCTVYINGEERLIQSFDELAAIEFALKYEGKVEVKELDDEDIKNCSWTKLISDDPFYIYCEDNIMRNYSIQLVKGPGKDLYEIRDLRNGSAWSKISYLGKIKSKNDLIRIMKMLGL